MRASLGQDLSSLREQQNRINASLGDIMDNIDTHMEDPKYAYAGFLYDLLHSNCIFLLY
ncbi:hypothetical protein DPMN_053950 [Dreissena polymorpha]|uniref:Uncharacterized protein n=1 Tax=Dreissena polymorpha TaxID=45954 RepID=A0A9D4HQS5_DREPO|nr:hypothetical protein DPMN_053950 [Dreissena polymorpha]